VIDVHVHFRDGSQSAKETILHGMQIGALCGIRAFFDMPNCNPPLIDGHAIKERIELGQKYADRISKQIGHPLFYGVYGGVTAEPMQLEHIVQAYRTHAPGMVALKMFAGHSTGNMGLVDPADQRNVFDNLALSGYEGVLAVHCEKETLLHPELWDPMRPWTHSISRGSEAELVSVTEQVEHVLSSGFKGTLHICHISTQGALEVVRQAKQSGVEITCGATAHHALLDCSAAGQNWNLLKMNPPLRSHTDRDAIFQGLLDGDIDWIESDHAPHTIPDKIAGASGIPGFAGTLLLIKALRDHHIDDKRLVALCQKRAATVFHIDIQPEHVVSDKEITELLPLIRASYPWDPFEFIR